MGREDWRNQRGQDTPGEHTTQNQLTGTQRGSKRSGSLKGPDVGPLHIWRGRIVGRIVQCSCGIPKSGSMGCP